MKKVYFVRHGETEANAANVFNAGTDMLLTIKGREQVQRASKKVQQINEKFDLIISSPRGRAQETARIIAEDIGYPVDQIEIDERLIERGAGDLEGQPVSIDLIDKYFLDRDNPAGAEWYGDVETRTAAFVDDLKKRPEDVILIIGHGGTGRMKRRLLGEFEAHTPVEDIKNGDVYQLYPAPPLDETKGRRL